MRLIRSFGYALLGLKQALEQTNLRIHFVALVVVVAMGFYFAIQPWEWCAVILSATLVISLELINTAIENLTDLVTKEQNPLAGRVKNIAASAVLVAAIGAIIVGVVVFWTYVKLEY